MIFQIRVYIASKLNHAEKFQKLSQTWENIYMTAGWVNYHAMVRAIPAGAQFGKPAMHWQQDNFDDIIRSHCVLAYVERGEHMKGGLVEIGFALAHGKKVFLCTDADEGQHPDFSAWQMGSSLVSRPRTIQRAIEEIKKFGWGQDKMYDKNGEKIKEN
jgi:nucleoside 2-deoxyribosyltransferase